jgi:hypothetical protein
VPSPRVRAVPVRAGGLAAAQLPIVDFADAYEVVLPRGVTARALADAVFTKAPGWVVALMALRHAIVAPLGLVASPAALSRAAARAKGTGVRVGVFPLLAETPGELVLGLDDRHLDFRVSVRVIEDGGAPLGVVTTRVRFHGALGRAYFVPVRPAHRVIVPALMRHAARRLGPG